GDNKAYRLQQKGIEEISSAESQKIKDVNELFSYLTSGSLAENDLLFFATPSITSGVAKVIGHRLNASSLESALPLIKDDVTTANDAIILFFNKTIRLQEIEKKEIKPSHVPQKKEKLISPSTEREENQETKKEILIRSKATIKPQKTESSYTPLETFEMPRKKFVFTPSKLVAMLIIIFIIVFAQSVFILWKKEQKQKYEARQQAIFASLNETQNKIAAALINKDENEARLLIGKAQNDLSSVDEKTKKDPRFNTVVSSLNEHINKLYKIEVRAPKDIMTLTGTINPTLLLKNNKLFYIVDNGALYVITETGKAEKIDYAAFAASSLFSFDNDNVVLASPQALFNYNAINHKVSSLALETKNLKTKTVFIVYNNRVYALDAPQNKIFRYTKSINGFSKEEEWLKQKYTFENIKLMTSDGALYFVNTLNKIRKFYAGREEQFKINDPYGQISSIDKMYTDFDKKYIYLFDQQNKKIIVLDKKGQIVKQLIIDTALTINDFWVNEKETSISLLSGAKVMEIGL
ncbi:MAG: hypothetical protein HYW78_00745, partial [Parcubacteria group bacterium]|nr:hypothetical protein [Parcubacteria group bacterium]